MGDSTWTESQGRGLSRQFMKDIDAIAARGAAAVARLQNTHISSRNARTKLVREVIKQAGSAILWHALDTNRRGVFASLLVFIPGAQAGTNPANVPSIKLLAFRFAASREGYRSSLSIEVAEITHHALARVCQFKHFTDVGQLLAFLGGNGGRWLERSAWANEAMRRNLYEEALDLAVPSADGGHWLGNWDAEGKGLIKTWVRAQDRVGEEQIVDDMGWFGEPPAAAKCSQLGWLVDLLMAQQEIPDALHFLVNRDRHTQRWLSHQLPDQLYWAYLTTTYESHDTPRPIHMRIGERNEELLELFSEKGSRCATFITAWNPVSNKTAEALNRAANAALEKSLVEKGCLIYRGVGRPAEVWDPEESFLVLGLERMESIAVAERFRQVGIVWVGESGVPELVLTHYACDIQRKSQAPSV